MGAPGWLRRLIVDAHEDLALATGDTRHVGIGTNFDGGQGVESQRPRSRGSPT